MQTATTVRLLDAWKVKQGISSDNAAAIELGVGRAAVSRWRAGLSHASPVYAEKMALDLGIDVCGILACIEADRATDSEIRKVWARIGKGAFMALLVGLGLSVPTAPGVAASCSSADVGSHYAKSRRRSRQLTLLPA